MGGICCREKPRISDAQPTSLIGRRSEITVLPKQQQEQQLEWPLPKLEQYIDFVPNNRIDNKRYSLVEVRFEKVNRDYFLSSIHAVSRHHRLEVDHDDFRMMCSNYFET